MITIKAKKEWLKSIEEHFKDYPWPLFASQFLIYEHQSNVVLPNNKVADIRFRVSVGNSLDYFFGGISFYLDSGRNSVRLQVPFIWKWLLQRRVRKLMRASLKEEMKTLRG
jgi:hypothetical protein